MSRLVARILLCVFMFPIAVVVYCAIVITFDRRYGYWSGNVELSIAGLTAWAFVAVYWILVWHKSVRWTLKRRLIPTLIALLGIVFGVAANFFLDGGQEDHIILLGILVPALWLIATVYCWQETTAERASRVRDSGRLNIACPVCGYNLTRLSEARCPECGTKFMLDELLAAQSAAPLADIE
jgi:DNA-directed RNA polymerase subunit RPC12/RpoP